MKSFLSIVGLCFLCYWGYVELKDTRTVKAVESGLHKTKEAIHDATK